MSQKWMQDAIAEIGKECGNGMYCFDTDSDEQKAVAILARHYENRPESVQPGETAEWETPCPKMEDGKHCAHWYDGGGCCACGDAAAPVAAPPLAPEPPSRTNPMGKVDIMDELRKIGAIPSASASPSSAPAENEEREHANPETLLRTRGRGIPERKERQGERRKRGHIPGCTCQRREGHNVHCYDQRRYLDRRVGRTGKGE